MCDNSGSELNCEQVSEWYVQRACEIEQLSGQVDGALELVKLGIERQAKVTSYEWFVAI